MKPIRFADFNSIHPCVILGAGVAGHAAAVWLDSYGVPFDWIADGGEVGGMLRRVYNKLVNVPGETFPHGPALVEGIIGQIDKSKFSSPRDARITKIIRDEGFFRLNTEAGEDVLARVVILATGTVYETLDVPGAQPSDLVFNEDSAIISYSASRDGERLAGKEVAVVVAETPPSRTRSSWQSTAARCISCCGASRARGARLSARSSNAMRSRSTRYRQRSSAWSNAHRTRCACT